MLYSNSHKNWLSHTPKSLHVLQQGQDTQFVELLLGNFVYAPQSIRFDVGVFHEKTTKNLLRSLYSVQGQSQKMHWVSFFYFQFSSGDTVLMVSFM